MNDYLRKTNAVLQYNLRLVVRRPRTLVIGAAALMPALLPIIIGIAMTRVQSGQSLRDFYNIMEFAYVKMMAPVMAIFFCTALLSDEIEGETMHYLISRPVPRSGLVLGKFLSYLVSSLTLLIPAMLLVLGGAAASRLIDFNGAILKATGHFLLTTMLALIGYGSLCLLAGILFRRPVIVAVIFVFAWEKFVTNIPGAANLLTISQYVNALLPTFPMERLSLEEQKAILQVQARAGGIEPIPALITLACITAAFLAISIALVRWRQFPGRKAEK